MPPTTLTIDELRLSPFNVRTNQADNNATDALERSILRNGLILPLVVHPLRDGPGLYGVHAGGRRYRSIRALVDRDDLPVDFAVAVVVQDLPEAALIEVSTAENLLRRELRPYELFTAVARAHGKGESVDKIAEVLGQEPIWVRRALRLARIEPTIFAALAAGTIDVDQAQAYAATEDHALQLAAWRQVQDNPTHLRGPDHIRRALRIGDRELDRMLAFIGLDAYRAAGGAFELDLFSDSADERGRIADEGLLRKLADGRLQAIREDVRMRASREVRFAAQPPQHEYGTDFTLLLSPAPVNGVRGALRPIELPAGDIVATLKLTDQGKADLAWWWASKKAKHAAARSPAKPKPGRPPAPPSSVPGAAIDLDATPASRTAANAAERVEALSEIEASTGLAWAEIETMRSLRRAILRAVLVRDARDLGTVAQDYLVWSQLRLAFAGDRTSHVGMGELHVAPSEADRATGHVRATGADREWRAALRELQDRRFLTGDDLKEAFLDYRASPAGIKALAAAAVAGIGLVRSLNHGGYRVPVHDAVAAETRSADDATIRALWTPTCEWLDEMPFAQRLAIAEPFIEAATFGPWSRLKSAELTQVVFRTVTGVAAGLRQSMKDAAAHWVHPYLRFPSVYPADNEAHADGEPAQMEDAA